MNDDFCEFNYVVSTKESYFNRLVAKSEDFQKHFRVSCDRDCQVDRLWNKIRRESTDNYNLLQLYRFQLYLPESIWELDKDAATARFE